MRKAFLIFGAILGATPPVLAQEARQAPAWCAALANFQYPETRIASADLALDTKTETDEPLPPHCIVKGFLQERTGVDGKPYATGFELRLPVEWNERFVFQGGGGTDGSVRPAVGTNTIGKPSLLTLGYAVVSTDAGHHAENSRDASFGMDPKARVDWAFNSLDLVVTAAKAIVQQGYDLYPRYSYIVGSSNGGRQGVMAAQRFPNHFDGILAGAPILEQSRGHIATAWDLQTVAKISPRDGEGRPILAKAYSDADIDLINAAITAQCDLLDGKEDGLVDSPLPCDFDPKVLECDGAKTEECLSADQMNALAKMHRGPVNSAQEPLHVSFPWDAGSDFRGWKLGDAVGWPSNARRATNTSIRYVFATPPAPDMDVLAFDFDRDPALLQGSASHTSAVSTDLDAFVQSGGKLILYHGLGDQGVSALGTTAYFDRLAERYDTLEDFARLYLLRNIGHSRTGTGPDTFDGFLALVDWVENERPPEALTITGGDPYRERLLCPYPEAMVWIDDAIECNTRAVVR